MEPPEFTNWQDAWEWHASQTHKALMEQSEDELIAILAQRRADAYYTLWGVVQKKCRPERAAPHLMAILRESEDDLIRYHCADALFGLLKITHLEELKNDAQWEHGARPEALAYLEKLVAKKLELRANQAEKLADSVGPKPDPEP